MREPTYLRAHKKGQTLPIIGLLLATGVLIGFLVIAIDGGSALLQRRTMQNGADAAVLAAVNYMGNNTLQSCTPQPCHPSYTLTTQEVYAQVLTLASNNRGGTAGATPSNYTVSMAWHYISGAPTYSGTYGLTLVNPQTDGTLVPMYVDGLVVTNTVANPTTFAKALLHPISQVTVTATSAGRLYPTCPPQTGEGHTLPFTRFLPYLQYDISQNPNDPNHPFVLWNSHADTSDANFKGALSLAQKSFTTDGSGNHRDQVITQFDLRYLGGTFEDGRLLHYGDCNNCDPYDTCGNNDQACANMAGSPLGNNDITDVGDWIFWRWHGTISITNTTAPRSPSRPGDWAETYTGDEGNNIHQAMSDLLNPSYIPCSSSYGGPCTGPLSGPPLNLGPAITLTVYMWGAPWADTNSNYSDDGSYAQYWDTCPNHNPNNCGTPQWDDLQITGHLTNNGPDFNIPNGNVNIDRVRFTKAYTMILYQQTVNSAGNSGVAGFILSPFLPGPNPGGCSWQAGGGVYGGPTSYP